MNKIEIENCVYQIHPVYDLYAANEAGYIINIVKKDSIKSSKMNTGYTMCNVRRHAQNGYKTVYVHRFVYECFNGLIPKDKVIDHVNNIKDDNRLCNLQLLTPQQNSKKSAHNRDFSYLPKAHENKKAVKAFNCTTNEITYFNSIYCCAQHLGINIGTIKKVCDEEKYRKTGISKKDECSYKFEYVREQDLPDNHIKSANIRTKMSDDDKKKHQKESVNRWQQKEFICPRCDKVMKNSNK